MKEPKQVTLICPGCCKATAHLIGYSAERDRGNGLPYIQGRGRCLECDTHEWPKPGGGC